jgi:poly(3-hydroxybutyrate) depolymerase
MRPAIARANRTARAIVLSALLAIACNSDDAVGPAPDPVPGPGDFTRVLAFDGRTRTYLLHVPPDIGSNASPPLILAFHGVPSGPEEIRSITGFDALADREGFREFSDFLGPDSHDVVASEVIVDFFLSHGL